MKNYLKHTFDLSSNIDYFDELPLWSAPFGLNLLDRVNLQNVKVALDIGCGAGFPLIEIASRLGPEAKVYGLDPWKEALQRVQKKLEFFSIAQVELLEGVAEKIPLPDHSLHLITSNNALNNVQDLDQALKECARCLKPGAQFLHTMNTDRSMFEFYDILETLLIDENLMECISLMKDHIYSKRKPVNEVLSLLHQNGIVCGDIIQDEFQYRYSSGTAMLNHHFVRIAFLDSWKKILPGDRIEELFTKLEKRLNEISIQQGLFTLTIPFVIFDARREN